MTVLVLLNHSGKVLGRYVSANQRSLNRIAKNRLRVKSNGVGSIRWERIAS